MNDFKVVWPDAAERQVEIDERIAKANSQFDDLFEAAQKEVAA